MEQQIQPVEAPQYNQYAPILNSSLDIILATPNISEEIKKNARELDAIEYLLEDLSEKAITKTKPDKNAKSFIETYPELIAYFSKYNRFKINEKFSTSAIVVWSCPNKCKHENYHYYERAINRRNTDRPNCPKCTKGTGVVCCNVLYLGSSENPRHIEIMKEWLYFVDDHNNKIELDIPKGEVTIKSRRRVAWQCENKHNIFYANVCDRTRDGPTNCLGCGTHAQIVPYEKSIAALYPDLAKLWDVSKNTSDVNSTPPFSNKKVWWICDEISENIFLKGKTPDEIANLEKIYKDPVYECNCKHSYQMTVDNKTHGQGCPLCAGKPCCIKKSFLSDNKHLFYEWDFERNFNIVNGNIKYIDPTKVAPAGSTLYHWVCQKKKDTCGCIHYFTAPIDKRTKENRGCPYCVNQPPFIDYHTSVGYVAPHLIPEWSADNQITPFQVAWGSTKNRIKWNCLKNKDHTWEIGPKYRIVNKTGCPHCFKDYSFGQCIWILYLMQTKNINIQYKLTKGGEFIIPEYKKYSADGYDPTTKTIYEYHGCYWHGCQKCYPNENKINSTSKIPFKDLYDKTQKKKEFCISKNYKYEEMWECDFNKLQNDKNIITLSNDEFKHYNNQKNKSCLCKICTKCNKHKDKIIIQLPNELNDFITNIIENNDNIDDIINEVLENITDNIDLPIEIKNEVKNDNIPRISDGKQEIDAPHISDGKQEIDVPRISDGKQEIDAPRISDGKQEINDTQDIDYNSYILDDNYENDDVQHISDDKQESDYNDPHISNGKQEIDVDPHISDDNIIVRSIVDNIKHVKYENSKKSATRYGYVMKENIQKLKWLPSENKLNKYHCSICNIEFIKYSEFKKHNITHL